MTLFRAIPISVHAALEVIAAPLLMVGPVLLGFSFETTVFGVVLGVLLFGLALSTEGDGRDGRAVPLSAHAAFDYLLAVATITVGVVTALFTNETAASVFFIGVGLAQVALTASTRFSSPARA
jgi:hypothetical protein